MNNQVTAIQTELLVLACQGGDSEALEQLFKQWSPPLARYIRRVSNDPGIVWDVVQETWLAVIKGIRRLDDASTFRSWIYAIAHNKCRDWQRKQQVRQRPTPGPCPPDPPSSTLDERYLRLEECLLQLSEEDRALITLFYFEEMTVHEVGNILAIPEGTVKSRLHRCRQELRKHMENTSHE